MKKLIYLLVIIMGIHLDECLIPGAKIIGPYSFFRSTISKIEFPDSLQKIYRYAFYECNHLRTIELPACNGLENPHSQNVED